MPRNFVANSANKLMFKLNIKVYTYTFNVLFFIISGLYWSGMLLVLYYYLSCGLLEENKSHARFTYQGKKCIIFGTIIWNTYQMMSSTLLWIFAYLFFLPYSINYKNCVLSQDTLGMACLTNFCKSTISSLVWYNADETEKVFIYISFFLVY